MTRYIKRLSWPYCWMMLLGQAPQTERSKVHPKPLY